MPVVLDNKIDRDSKEKLLNDPAIKEIDVASISEKDIFVRKADIVYLLRLIYL